MRSKIPFDPHIRSCNERKSDMETIRNYLESMFSQLPNTPEVLKAKYELGQMMEDKYSELIADGKSENKVYPLSRDTMSFSFSDFYYIFVCCVEASK